MEKAIIISRCSTSENRQDVTRQSQDLTSKYSNRFDITKTFEYYQSGTKNENENDTFLKFAINNNIQNILVTELSRISRTVIGFLNFKKICDEAKINIIIDDKNLNTLNQDKSIDLNTELILTIGASFAKMELIQTALRLNSGRAKYIRDGGKLGRKEGSIKDQKKLKEEHADIIKFLKQGQSVRNTMKLTGKSSGTIQKIKKILQSELV
ncbi:recombinase family protein [Flavobacterium soyangense]|uniref:Recombinase family protein n=1 Tax=Flavobacterium soyangense TaxID=2023265 RepID=A0A930UEV0_9FLAO|nr:recombinase family protein [Flavobacterium soyangense]MBF2710006.1 recombinase family protein [Flavobacterium soyangense]